MQKIKFIAFSDQHLEKNLYSIPELGKDLQRLIVMVVDKAIELKVDAVVSVGDLFDHNRPTSETIKFMTKQVGRLVAAGITPYAIAGDHSKPVNGATWEHVIGFKPVNDHPAFVGVDYSDNPAQVTELLNNELATRPENTVQFMFMHQQVPELWPFCEEKKAIHLRSLDLSRHCQTLQGIFLGDIHIRRDMRYMPPGCDRELYVGYCGSLGVTSGDETNKQGLYYWNGDALEILPYELPRKFITIDVREDEDRSVFNPAAYEKYKGQKNRPVFLCKLYGNVEVKGRLNFLYDIGYVKMSKVKVGKDGQEELVNIRSELKVGDRFSSVLATLLHGTENADEVKSLVLNLLTEPDPKAVLDRFKDEIYSPKKPKVA